MHKIKTAETFTVQEPVRCSEGTFRLNAPGSTLAQFIDFDFRRGAKTEGVGRPPNSGKHIKVDLDLDGSATALA